MTLIKKAKATNSDDRKRISELWDSISNIDSTISKLQEQKKVLQKKLKLCCEKQEVKLQKKY